MAVDHQRLRQFFDQFTVNPWHAGLRVLRVWQQVVRFGATALFISTLLTLLGLVLGDRRARTALCLFGLGGVSLLAAPALTGGYSGRYTVPMALPLLSASAIALHTLVRRSRLSGQRNRARALGGIPALQAVVVLRAARAALTRAFCSRLTLRRRTLRGVTSTHSSSRRNSRA